MSSTARPLWLQSFKAATILFSFAALLAIYLPALPVAGRFFYPYRYREVIEAQAKADGLDPLFVATVIRQESGFRPRAHSAVGAIGLMQLMPQTAQWASQQAGVKNFRPDALEDPTTNIKLGCWYLRYLFSQFHDPAMVLAAYNGGEGNLAYWGKLKGEQLHFAYPETQSYVESGMRAYQRYKALYPPDRALVTAPALRVLR